MSGLLFQGSVDNSLTASSVCPLFRCNPQAGAEVTAGSTNIRDVCAEGSVRATCCLNATCGRAE